MTIPNRLWVLAKILLPQNYPNHKLKSLIKKNSALNILTNSSAHKQLCLWAGTMRFKKNTLVLWNFNACAYKTSDVFIWYLVLFTYESLKGHWVEYWLPICSHKRGTDWANTYTSSDHSVTTMQCNRSPVTFSIILIVINHLFY